MPRTPRTLLLLVALFPLVAAAPAAAEDLAVAEATDWTFATARDRYEDDLRAVASLSQVQKLRLWQWAAPLPGPAAAARVERNGRMTEGLALQRFTAANTAKRFGMVSTGGFGVDFAGLATGTVLVLTIPRAKKTGSVRRWVSLRVMKVRADSALVGVRGAF